MNPIERARVVLCLQSLPVPKDPRVWRQAVALADADFDVTVIAPRAQGQARAEVLDGVRVVRYRAPIAANGVPGLILETLVGLCAIGWHTLALHRQQQIHVLQLENPPDVYFPLAWLLRLSGTKVVFDLRDPTVEVLRAKLGDRMVLVGLLRWLERRSFRSAHLVITVNGSCRRLAVLRGSIPDDRVIVVRTGPDGIEPAAPRPADRGAGRVIFAGIMGEQDGVETLLRAIAKLHVAQGRRLELELVGDGPDVPRLRRLVADLGIDEVVTWAGWVTREDLRTRLAHASIAVSPDADSELNRIATMLKIADYLAEGLAVVASDLPETRITCADAVLYVTPGDADALAAGIAQLLDDDELRERLGRAARERATRLVWQPGSERLVAAYRWLLGRGPAVDPDQTV